MMREIKFRAWDKVNESMHDVQGISFYHESISVDRGDGTYFANHASNFELMQYTGLKDKDGVEIYEGDIVKVNYNVVPEVKIITYHNASFGIRDNEMGFVPLAIFERPSKNLIVIGNIYENPELLGDSQ